MNQNKRNFVGKGLSCLFVFAVVSIVVADAATGQPANYEGFGTVTKGAADAPGGYETYHVTSLANSGAGTFRDAVSQGSRLVVFDIGGTVRLTGSLYIRSVSYLTIDGSSAPSPGITVSIPSGSSFYFLGEAHDIVMNNVRFDGNYIGPVANRGDVGGLDGQYGTGPVSNIIIDHCTFTSAGDGVFDTRGRIENVTYSWNLFKDTDFMGSFGDPGYRRGISFHHNVLARGGERMPKIENEEGATTTQFDMVNNVVYGWGTPDWTGNYGLAIRPAGWLLELHVTGNWYEDLYGSGSNAIAISGSGHQVDFEGNVFPSDEFDDVDTAVLPPPIPSWARVTTYDASTLGDTVVPFVGTHYPTAGETDLLNEISATIGGGQGRILSVSSTSGGSVTSPGEGSFPYDDGTVVPIAAAAENNYHFVSWTGTAADAGKVANPNAAATTVTVDSSYTLRANFATALNTITISSTNGGSVSDPGEGSFQYDDRLVVSIVATAASGYHFVNWTGSAVDAGQVADPDSASTTVTANADYTLRANFSIEQHNLTISSNSGGSVSVPGEGTHSYDNGALASVVASPAADFHFVNWTGSAVDAGKVANSTHASTTVTMDADYTINANFAVDRHTLTISSTSGGSVTSPGEGPLEYDSGAGVSIQAAAAIDHYFINWTGTAVSAGKVANPNAAGTEVTVDADYTIQANFGASDGTAPKVTDRLPDGDDFQVPLNSLITLHLSDALGVDAGSVEIRLDGDLIYTGDDSEYASATGVCRRVGTPTHFTYAYQPSWSFDFDQLMTVTVSAADLGGVVMDEQSYSFRTEMRSFGRNTPVSSASDNLDSGKPATVRDADGNIWAVWHTGPAGARKIYVAKLAAGAQAFGASVRISSRSADQANPAVGLGADNKLYVVWQDNREGDWDIYGSTSTNGTSWSVEQRLVDANDNHDQTYPAVAIDGRSPNRAHVVWQEGAAGNRNIYIATSSNNFVTNTVTKITSNSSEQTDPAVAVDSQNTVYVVWTDGRTAANGSDIYGAASNDGPWTNLAVVAKPANQSSPAIAAESSGSKLHMLWVDATVGDSGIYYGSSDGVAGPLTGANIIDDGDKGKGQTSPAIAVKGAGGELDVFACWRDGRHADTDIFFVQTNPAAGTNVFVGDGGTNSNQSEPAIDTDLNGYPYLVWTDDRGANTEIYFAASRHMQSTPLAAGLVTSASSVQTVGTDPANIDDVDDVSVVLPAHASPYDVTVTMSRIANPPEYALPILNGYDFGPSGLVFNSPVTITIPYVATGAGGTPAAYWYDSRTGTVSQQGITDPEIIVLSPTLHALTFKTLHFTPYYVLQVPAGVDIGGGIDIGSDGGGGGGCTLSHSRQGNVLEYFLPYGVLALFMFILRGRDRRSVRLRKERL